MIDVGTISVDLAAVNDAPVATGGEQYTTIGSQSVTLNSPLPDANDIDVDGDTLMVSIVGAPANGFISVDANGDFVYTPNAGFSGTESIQYVVSDGITTSNIVTLDVEVLAAPAGNDGGGGTNPGGSDSGEDDMTTPVGVGTGEPMDPPEESNESQEDSSTTVGASNNPTGQTADEIPQEQEMEQQFVATSSEGVAATLAEDETSGIELPFWNISSTDVEITDEFSAEIEMFERLLQLDLEQAIVWQQWDDANQLADESAFSLYVGSAGVGAGIFSIGYAFWALRGGAVLSMIASSLPAWRMIDPAALLEAYRRSVEIKQEGIEKFFD